ncbi:DNA cytosine methyltransferase [Aminivibrio sp.]|uniref:DNA cytosine methyltransferase n=1 Tax=Aminivibrio sp. TaxID=1872489 RepID=UPI003D99C016
MDLFAGAGGMTLGFTDSRFCGDFSCVFSLDFDHAAMLTHSANFGGTHVVMDIEQFLLSGSPLPAADVVIGGPPCQGFSLLNKDRSGDPRRALWEPFLEVVFRSGASVFVMENVAELLRSPEMAEINSRAEQNGFLLHAAVLNAADYGAPQVRKRTVSIGAKADLFPFGIPLPDPTHSGRWRTVREAIGDLPEPVGTEIRDEPPPLDLHFGRNPTAMSLERYRAVPPGGNRFDLQNNAPHLLPECWRKKTSGGTDLFGRLWWDRPSVTIRTEFFKPEKGRYLHPEDHRPITHREAARLMGFPDDFIFRGSKTEIARQIGNAVPPRLASAVAMQVRAALRKSFEETGKKRRAS